MSLLSNSDCDWASDRHTGTVSCLSGYVASHRYDTVFKCLVSPCMSDGTILRCVLLVGPGQELDGLEDVVHTCDGVCLDDHCGAEGSHGVAGFFPGVWNDSTSSK